MSLARSLDKQTIKPDIWILVDNAPISEPTFIPAVAFPVLILPGEEGDGFGCGCNTGLNFLSKRSWLNFAWLLNPDTNLASNTHIECLMNQLNTLKNNSLIGTAVVNSDGMLEQSGGWIRNGLGYRKSQIDQSLINKELRHPLSVDWISGCNLIFKPSSFSNLLRFDPYFPLYFEDIDFCLRAKALGGQCIWINALRINHQKGKGSECSLFRRERLKTISQIRFLRRYQSRWVLIAHILRIIILAFGRMPIQFDSSLGKLCGALQVLQNH